MREGDGQVEEKWKVSVSGPHFRMKNLMIVRKRRVVSPSSAYTAVPGFFAAIAFLF